MNIHHATIKSAAAKGIALVLHEDREAVEALYSASGLAVEATVEDDEATAAAKQAWADLDDVMAYNADEANLFTVRWADGDFIAWRRTASIDDIVARDPVWEDLRETLDSGEGLDKDEPADEDEPETTGSVVPARYKVLYAERGDPTHCGDWLAVTLQSLCRVTEDGKEVTDLDRLEAIANANGVAPERYGKLGVITNGWQGRYRMTVRNMLTKRVADKGFIFIPEGCGVDADEERPAPAEWCASHSTRAKAKPAKATADVQANPGAGKPSATTIAKQAGLDGVAAAGEAIRAAKAKGTI